MRPMQTAETRSRQSDNPRLYMLAFSAGWNAAADGGDLDGYARKVGLEGEVGFIEGAAAYRTKKATARDFVAGSPAHVHHLLEQR